MSRLVDLETLNTIIGGSALVSTFAIAYTMGQWKTKLDTLWTERMAKAKRLALEEHALREYSPPSINEDWVAERIRRTGYRASTEMADAFREVVRSKHVPSEEGQLWFHLCKKYGADALYTEAARLDVNAELTPAIWAFAVKRAKEMGPEGADDFMRRVGAIEP
jgi:hypothetical protein